jgi:hypothetical protein
MAQLTTGHDVMNFKVHSGTADLAAPPVALKDGSV